MVIFVKTQTGKSAANSFLENLKRNKSNFKTINHKGKGIISFLKISHDLRKNLNILPMNTKIVADCGCLKILLILLFSSYDLNCLDNVYTTFYHHLIAIKDINIDFSKSEIWKVIGLKLYLKIVKFFKLKSFNFITVSEFSKDLLLRNYSIRSSNIFVF